MTAKPLVTTTACAAALLMAACGSARFPTYYALHVAPQPKPAASDGRRTMAVAVRRFDTADYIRQGRIVYSETPELQAWTGSCFAVDRPPPKREVESQAVGGDLPPECPLRYESLAVLGDEERNA
jgi:hypothetical protein